MSTDENKGTHYGQFWIKDAEPRAMFTDDRGGDYDIMEMRDALVSIRDNTRPDAVSLTPKNRIKAIHQICCKALP